MLKVLLLVAAMAGLVNETPVSHQLKGKTIFGRMRDCVNFDCMPKPMNAVHSIGDSENKVDSAVFVLGDSPECQTFSGSVVIAGEYHSSSRIECFAPRPTYQKILCDLPRAKAIRAKCLPMELDVNGRGFPDILDSEINHGVDFTANNLDAALGFQRYFEPRARVIPDKFVCLAGSLCRFDGGLVRFIGGPERQNENEGGRDGEGRHDPLRERIARANKRPDEPIPVSWYLAAIGIAFCIAGVLGLIAFRIVEPDD